MRIAFDNAQCIKYLLNMQIEQRFIHLEDLVKILLFTLLDMFVLTNLSKFTYHIIILQQNCLWVHPSL